MDSCLILDSLICNRSRATSTRGPLTYLAQYQHNSKANAGWKAYIADIEVSTFMSMDPTDGRALLKKRAFSILNRSYSPRNYTETVLATVQDLRQGNIFQHPYNRTERLVVDVFLYQCLLSCWKNDESMVCTMNSMRSSQVGCGAY